MCFSNKLAGHGLMLTRGIVNTLQVNVGLLCDLACNHCHLEAGPHRTESMSLATVTEVIELAERLKFDVADITGGAPELLPFLPQLIDGLSARCGRVMVRTNLVALLGDNADSLLQLYSRHKVTIIASLPATYSGQTDAQRGGGVMDKSLESLKQLNNCGYGLPDTGLILDIACNPAGAFMPLSQKQAEQRFRSELMAKYGISFNSLYSFANVPLGRYRRWLESSGNFDRYLARLESSFNPATLSGLMCRNTISVSWDGYIYDCDFNQAAALPSGGSPIHISSLMELPAHGSGIAIGEHCYACTAGAGFTCGGSVVVS